MKSRESLIDAQEKAKQLFDLIEEKKIISAGKSEREINDEILSLANNFLNVKKFWHKRIVRANENTLHPYKENPPNLIVQTNDIAFVDLGPVFEEWEADFGRTFVIGNDAKKIKLKNDIEHAWQKAVDYYFNSVNQTGAQYFDYIKNLATEYGWEYGGPYAGHLVGKFPHEKLIGEDLINYIHPENNEIMQAPDKNGDERFWILEIHFVDKTDKIGGFYEQLLIQP
ncbi:MAG: M24 family metallopeptidase [Bacteroidota bacterium]